MRVIDGIYEEIRDDCANVARALVAGGGPMKPPKAWFADPSLERPTPITVTADGKIFGHIASWQTSHIGLPPGTKPPRSRSGYGYFQTGVLETEEGEDVPVGQLTLAGGHAPLNASAQKAIEHYDRTESAVADLAVGEDSHGIWVSGAVRPGVTDSQIRALRASAPSGDWRPIEGSLELVAVCQVNTPGFPVARAMVADGQVQALVAAGAAMMYGLQQESSVFAELQALDYRIAALEQEAITAGAKPAPPFNKKKADEGAPQEEAADEEPEADESDDEEVAAQKQDDLRARFAARKKTRK